MNSDEFDLGLIIPEKTEGATPANNDPIVRFPKKIMCNIEFDVEHFLFNRFETRGLSGQLLYEPGLLFLDSPFFNSMQGAVSGNIVATEQNPNLFDVQIYTSLNAIDIQDLFYAFKDFGQSFISRFWMTRRSKGSSRNW